MYPPPVIKHDGWYYISPLLSGLGVLRTIIVAGIFGIPILCQLVGIGPLVLGVLGSGGMTVLSMYCLIVMAIDLDTRTFGELVARLIPRHF